MLLAAGRENKCFHRFSKVLQTGMSKYDILLPVGHARDRERERAREGSKLRLVIDRQGGCV